MIAESISGLFTSLLSALTSFLVTSIFVSGCDPHTNFPTGPRVGIGPKGPSSLDILQPLLTASDRRLWRPFSIPKPAGRVFFHERTSVFRVALPPLVKR